MSAITYIYASQLQTIKYLHIKYSSNIKKILSFIIFSTIESYEEIKELRDTNECVEHVVEKYLSNEMQSKEEAKANAIHFCNGGVKDSLSQIKESIIKK